MKIDLQYRESQDIRSPWPVSWYCHQARITLRNLFPLSEDNLKSPSTLFIKMFSKQQRSSALWTRLAYLFAAFWLLSCLHSGLVTGSPTHLLTRQDDDTLPDDPNDVDDPVAAGDPVPTEDKYPDLESCRSSCSVVADKSLFYSQVGSHKKILKRTRVISKRTLTSC